MNMNISKLNSALLKLGGIGTMMIVGMLRFWMGIILFFLTVIIFIEFCGSNILGIITTYGRCLNGFVSYWQLAWGVSMLVISIGFGLVVGSISIRTFWGFWRIW